MKKKQEDLLEEYLWELTKQIRDGVPGLPLDWMQNRVKDLADIFHPLLKTNSNEV